MGGWVDAVVIVMLMCAYILRPFCAFYVMHARYILQYRNGQERAHDD